MSAVRGEGQERLSQLHCKLIGSIFIRWHSCTDTVMDDYSNHLFVCCSGLIVKYNVFYFIEVS